MMIKESILKKRGNNCKYAPNIEAPEYIKQILSNTKGEVDSNTIIVEELNTSLISRTD